MTVSAIFFIFSTHEASKLRHKSHALKVPYILNNDEIKHQAKKERKY